MISDDIMDLKEFLERVQDDKELLLELLDIFSDDYKVKRQALGEAIKTNDADQLRSIAHSLKGASGNISAKRLRNIFLQIEEIAKADDNIAPAKDYLNALDAEFADLEKRFTEVRKELA